MASSMKEICPICGLEFYDLDFHLRNDEECPEIAQLLYPDRSTLDSVRPNASDVWTVRGVGRLLRLLHDAD